VVSVLLCGLAPALATTRTSPLDAMRAQALSGVRLKMPARKIFVVAQLAVSMALLMATGLLVRTLIHVETMDMGFNSSQNALLMTLAMGQGGPQVQAEFDALATRMRALPGVKDATIARIVPFAGSGTGATKFVLAPGELPSETAGTPVWFNSVDDAYFRVMGVPLERGRSFQTQDGATSEKVAIGWHLDGRVTAVVGTHTHVPTADARVLPGGTAYCTDVGMTGSRAGVIGVVKEVIITKLRTGMPNRFDSASGDEHLMGVLVEADRDGSATAITQLIVPAELD